VRLLQEHLVGVLVLGDLVEGEGDAELAEVVLDGEGELTQIRLGSVQILPRALRDVTMARSP